jgi:4-amino-4-deoxy-L-arabinose transferase-like glycosyltransferase
MPSRVAIAVVAAVTILRLFIGAHVPLSEDEAYYWSWSLHPAFGYVDHPPGVMLTILAFAWLGHSTLAIRLGFIIAAAAAALLAGAATRELGCDERSATVATIVFAFLPQLRLFVGEALPDGPYLLSWVLALYAAARFFARRERGAAILLGIALGAAVLSRAFGWALVLGVAAYAMQTDRKAWRDGLWISLAIAVLLFLPFVAWNATHHWANFAFTTLDRSALQLTWPPALSSIRCLMYTAIIVGIAYATAIRTRLWLIVWTTLPLVAAFALLSLFETVESYWLLGPVASLVVSVGIAVTRAGKPIQWTLGAVYALAACIAIAAAGFPALPEGTQARLMQALPATRAFYSPAASYASLAVDVASFARAHRASLISDKYEVAAEMLYYGVPVEMIGNRLGAMQWEMWQTSAPIPRDALVVTDEPFHGAYRLQSTYAGRPALTLYIGNPPSAGD